MRKRAARHSGHPAGSILVIALLFMALLSLLGVTLLTVASTEHSLSYNAIWSEGALMSAEAGVNRGINQLSADPSTSVAAIPVTVLDTSNTYRYRSGSQTASSPQPITFIGSRAGVGYSLSVSGGYTFNVYQITATGTGPRNAAREVEAEVQYGPISTQ